MLERVKEGRMSPILTLFSSNFIAGESTFNSFEKIGRFLLLRDKLKKGSIHFRKGKKFKMFKARKCTSYTL